MSRRSSEILVGLFVVTGLAVTLFGIFTIRGIGVGDTATYFARYSNVSTLTAGTAVKYHGHLVGRVKGVDIDADLPEKILVALEIRGDTPITDATVARITRADLLGDVHVDLAVEGAAPGSAGTLRSTGKPLPPGSYLQAGEPFDLGASLLQAQHVLELAAATVETLNRETESALRTVRAVLEDTREVLSADNREKVAQAISDVASAANEARQLMADGRERMSSVMDATEAALEGVPRVTAELETAVAEIRPQATALIASLEAAVDATERLVQDLGSTVDAVDPRQLDETLRNLETTSRNLAELSRDVKDRPYLLLRKEKQPKEKKR